VFLVVKPCWEQLSLAERQANVHSRKKTSTMLAHGCWKVRVQALSLDEGKRTLNSGAVLLVAWLAHEDEKDPSLFVDEGLGISGGAVSHITKTRRGRLTNRSIG
jgi:hypothetical protein